MILLYPSAKISHNVICAWGPQLYPRTIRNILPLWWWCSLTKLNVLIIIFCKPNINNTEANHEELLTFNCRIPTRHPNLDPTLSIFWNFSRLKVCRKTKSKFNWYNYNANKTTKFMHLLFVWDMNKTWCYKIDFVRFN